MKGPQSVTRTLHCLFLTILLLPAAAVAVADDSHRRIVAFGDSLVDSGNVFALTGELTHKPYAVIPGAPYPIGGPQFSNGPTWVEQLAKKLGAGPSTGPSLRANGVFTNYAYGGARARAEGDVPSLSDQVTAFLADHGGYAPGDALYAIAIGGNDLRDAVNNPPIATMIAGAAVQSVANNLVLLIERGARHFVISNLPNLAALPALAGLPPTQREQVFELAFGVNMQFEAVLAQIVDATGVDIDIVDGFGLSSDIADPQLALELGFEAGTTPCLSFGVQDEAICNDRDAHFYWDGIHPSRAGHALIAQRAFAAVTPD